jgi:hypothetical protein
VSDAGEEQGDEVDEVAGVEEWIADESEAQANADGADDAAVEESPHDS